MKPKLILIFVNKLLLVFISAISLVSAQSDNDVTQADSDASQIVEKIDEQAVPVAQAEQIVQQEEKISAFDRQLITELDVYQKRLITALAEEDAFSLKLSEVYSEYGALLLKAGRSDEANAVFNQAMHIQKVNHGIYSQEQLYFLKQLLAAAIAKDDEEAVENYLTRAIAIENKSEGLVSEDIDDMFLLAGHYYVDQYYQLSRRYKTKLSYLRNARNYFEQILARSRNTPLAEVSLPYGELMLVGYLENNLIHEMPVVINSGVERFNASTLSASSEQLGELTRDYRYVKGAYGRSFRSFNNYIRKAREGGDSEDIVSALLSWADTLILFNRTREASNYYRQAWQESQEIFSTEKMNSLFQEPQRIPAYDYLIDRNDESLTKDIVNVPLIFSIEKDGSVTNIELVDSSDEQKEYSVAATNEARSLNFRPAIINGDITAVDQFTYEIPVAVN